MTALTLSQAVALSYIEHSLNVLGVSPTIEWIGEQMELRTPIAAMSFVRALHRKGLILRRHGEHRSIQICWHVDVGEEVRKAVGS